jgi:S-adenosylmethionine/arginine decarboxylase-like enzyme
VLLAESHLAIHTWPRPAASPSTSMSATSRPTTRPGPAR